MPETRDQQVERIKRGGGYYRTSPKAAAARTKRIADSPAAKRKRLQEETFRLSEERRKDQESKRPKPPKPKPPKSAMQRFKESVTRRIGLGGVLDALEPKKNKKK